ncbi:MAG: serine/threonine protein kinase, partial [Cyanobacteriota bacterium]|nr:serine/threonine protein kinase [Cyanobacteriota bacterium]
ADLANRFQSLDGESLSTLAVEPGYAPPEQRQTGTVNPSSDLYALAATAVVLLTGKEPHQLFDSTARAWQWQPHARVSPEFAAVLNRMLAPRSGERYSAAIEVLQALELLSAPVHPKPSPSSPKTAVSEMATQAVGGQPEPVGKQPEPTRAASPSPAREPFIPERGSESLWESPWVLGALTVLLAIVAGAGASGLVVMLFRSQPQETPAPSPTESVAENPSPTPEETPSPSPQPSPPTQRIPLLGGESFVDRGRLVSGAIANYVIPAEADQRLQVALDSSGVVLKILKPDGRAIAADASSVKNWEGALQEPGDYTIQLLAVPGFQESDYNYQLSIRLNDAPTTTPSPSPTVAPSPAASPTSPPEPNIDREPVFLPFDSIGEPLALQGQTSPETVKRYLVDVEAGQVLRADVLQGRVTLNVRFPNGQLVDDAEEVQFWEGEILQGGQYQIDVVSDRASGFALSIAVRDTAP